MLTLVFRLWIESRKWPIFATVDKQLDDEGFDALDLFRELYPSHLLSESGGSHPSSGTEISLTTAGLAVVPTGDTVAAAFVSAVRFLAEADRVHVATPQEPMVSLGSEELASYFETSAGVPRPRSVAAAMVQQVKPFLQADGWLWTHFADDESTYRMTLSREVRRFRDVESLGDYLARRNAMLKDSERKHNAATINLSEVPVSGDMEIQEDGPDRRAVFIVHGRDLDARDALFEFLRSLDLRPIEFEQMVAATGSAAPYTGDAVVAGFKSAQAVIVLLTPDDEARLHGELRGVDEPEHETTLTGQARPNVLFEAGMALALHPDRTVIVEIGKLRPFSDVAGRHTVRIRGANSLHALANRLERAGCTVVWSGSDWLRTERFDALSAHKRAPASESDSQDVRASSQLPRGRVLESAPKTEPEPNLEARLHGQGTGQYLLEIVNRGGVRLESVGIEMPAEAQNWHLLTAVLPQWPIESLDPRDYRRFPVTISMGGPVMIEATLVATTVDARPYRKKTTLSIYG